MGRVWPGKPHQDRVTEQVLKRVQETRGHGHRGKRGQHWRRAQKAGQDFRSQTCRGRKSWHSKQKINKQIKMESEERPGGKLARIKHGGRRNGLAERQTVGSTGSHRTTRKPPSKSSQGGAKAEGLTFVSGPCLPPVLPRVIVVCVCVCVCICVCV